MLCKKRCAGTVHVIKIRFLVIVNACVKVDWMFAHMLPTCTSTKLVNQVMMYEQMPWYLET